MTSECHQIVARDKAALLIHMMRHLAGNTHISFEGDLSRCLFSFSPSDKSKLKRVAITPQLDFVVLDLTRESLSQISNIILSDSKFMKDIIHIQIEKNGSLAFGCYDNFHPECIVYYCSGDSHFLENLRSKQIIK